MQHPTKQGVQVACCNSQDTRHAQGTATGSSQLRSPGTLFVLLLVPQPVVAAAAAAAEVVAAPVVAGVVAAGRQKRPVVPAQMEAAAHTVAAPAAEEGQTQEQLAAVAELPRWRAGQAQAAAGARASLGVAAAALPPERGALLPTAYAHYPPWCAVQPCWRGWPDPFQPAAGHPAPVLPPAPPAPPAHAAGKRRPCPRCAQAGPSEGTGGCLALSAALWPPRLGRTSAGC